MFCCLRTCLNGNIAKPHVNGHRIKGPDIHFDAAKAGPEVILLSNQLRITGTGGSLATAPLVQSKSYFEVKIQQSGSWSMGLATQQTDLSSKVGGNDKYSWCLCSDNATRHNGEENRPIVVLTQEPTGNSMASSRNNLQQQQSLIDDMPADKGSESNLSTADMVHTLQISHEAKHTFPGEGDIVGVAFDHVELNFYFNGVNLEVPFRNVKGEALYPVVYVGDGAILDIILDNFHHNPPAGFDKIMLEQSLL